MFDEPHKVDCGLTDPKMVEFRGDGAELCPKNVARVVWVGWRARRERANNGRDWEVKCCFKGCMRVPWVWSRSGVSVGARVDENFSKKDV